MRNKNIAIIILILAVVGGFGFAYAQGRTAGKLRASVDSLQTALLNFHDRLKIKTAADSARQLLIAEQNVREDSLRGVAQRARRLASGSRRRFDSLIATLPDSVEPGFILDSVVPELTSTVVALENANDACEGALTACDSAKFVQRIQREADSVSLAQAQVLLRESDRKIEQLTDAAFPSFGASLFKLDGGRLVQLGVVGGAMYFLGRATASDAKAEINFCPAEQVRLVNIEIPIP